MAVERKMHTKALSFAPGKPAVTPFEAEMGAVEAIEEQPNAPQPTDPVASQKLSPVTLKGVVVYLAPAEAIALKVYAAENSTSIQQLGIEALADLFQKRGINGGVLTRVRANRKNGGNR
jgi:hypothetical protein